MCISICLGVGRWGGRRGEAAKRPVEQVAGLMQVELRRLGDDLTTEVGSCYNPGRLVDICLSGARPTGRGRGRDVGWVYLDSRTSCAELT